MRLTRTAYYADFVIYPVLLGGIATVAVAMNDRPGRLTWTCALLAGALSWTLIEYLLHRFVLHRMPVFAAMHEVHHAAPRAYVGTPTWLSLGVVACVVFLPTFLASSLNVASGVAAGVMAGFFWYGLVHHTIHYRRPRRLAARLSTASRRHFVHHYSKQPGNFGVTTALWDHVFGTTLPPVAPRRPADSTPVDP